MENEWMRFGMMMTIWWQPLQSSLSLSQLRVEKILDDDLQNNSSGTFPFLSLRSTNTFLCRLLEVLNLNHSWRMEWLMVKMTLGLRQWQCWWWRLLMVDRVRNVNGKSGRNRKNVWIVIQWNRLKKSCGTGLEIGFQIFQTIYDFSELDWKLPLSFYHSTKLQMVAVGCFLDSNTNSNKITTILFPFLWPPSDEYSVHMWHNINSSHVDLDQS